MLIPGRGFWRLTKRNARRLITQKQEHADQKCPKCCDAAGHLQECRRPPGCKLFAANNLKEHLAPECPKNALTSVFGVLACRHFERPKAFQKRTYVALRVRCPKAPLGALSGALFDPGPLGTLVKWCPDRNPSVVPSCPAELHKAHLPP